MVFILFYGSVLHDGNHSQIFGVYSNEATAYAEKDRLEGTGKYNCTVLPVVTIND